MKASIFLAVSSLFCALSVSAQPICLSIFSSGRVAQLKALKAEVMVEERRLRAVGLPDAQIESLKEMMLADSRVLKEVRRLVSLASSVDFVRNELSEMQRTGLISHKVWIKDIHAASLSTNAAIEKLDAQLLSYQLSEDERSRLHALMVSDPLAVGEVNRIMSLHARVAFIEAELVRFSRNAVILTRVATDSVFSVAAKFGFDVAEADARLNSFGLSLEERSHLRLKMSVDPRAIDEVNRLTSLAWSISGITKMLKELAATP